MNAVPAALASECARDQGKFREYHDLLFENGQADGSGLYREDLENYVTDLGLNLDVFITCMDSGEKENIIDLNIREGLQLEVTSVPTFFINGVRIEGNQPIEIFEEAIMKDLIVN